MPGRRVVSKLNAVSTFFSFPLHFAGPSIGVDGANRHAYGGFENQSDLNGDSL